MMNLPLKKGLLHILVENWAGTLSETCSSVPIYSQVQHAGWKWCQPCFVTSFDSSHELNGLWAAPPYDVKSFFESGQRERISLGCGRGTKCLLLLCQVSFLGVYPKATNGMRSEHSSRLHNPVFYCACAKAEGLACLKGTSLWNGTLLLNECGWMGNSGKD